MIGRAVVAAALLSAAAHASAHEVRHEVVRGRAVAVRAFFAGGEPLAYAEYQVFAPSDPRVPHQKGRTDRAGWLAFVPAEAGAWRVQVIDATGHGLDVEVRAEPDPAPAAAATGRAGAVPLGRVLGPLAGVAVIGALFAALVLAHRRRRSA